MDASRDDELAVQDQLEFRGRDSEECENFIRHVLKQARAAGKQRDDEWMADFAASCFAHGAMRWWDGLEEQTQSSWKLLRKAMLSRYRPLFHGKSGEEAEEFVHMVHERAVDVGKQLDNQWMAMFTVSCFVGDALRWYSSLDPDIRTDWERLRQAILTQYPRDGSSTASISTFPTPAPAGPPPTTTASRGRGRIRVVSADKSRTFYVSRTLDGNGYVVMTLDDSESLQVEYNPFSEDRQTLRIPNDQIPGFDLLEMLWYPANATSMAILCAVNSESGKHTLKWQGTLLPRPWQISSHSNDAANPGLITLSATSGTVNLHAQVHNRLSSAAWFYPTKPDMDLVFLFLEPI